MASCLDCRFCIQIICQFIEERRLLALDRRLSFGERDNLIEHLFRWLEIWIEDFRQRRVAGRQLF